MLEELKHFLVFIRPAFSRRATYCWFVLVFVGFILRTDNFGVSSIVRALTLSPESYTCLLHFFHSTAWNVNGIMSIWWQWLVKKDIAHRINDRLVLVGDHTKTPKDGRKMPAVATLHQDSETSSKPSYFRGHHWGCIGILMQACDKYFAVPLWANIQEGLTLLTNSDEKRHLPKTVQIVEMAMKGKAYLVLDAYFAVGPVFLATTEQFNGVSNFVHILVRAKKNIVAYGKPPKKQKHQRGRPREYGKKLKLMSLFDSKANCWLRTVSFNAPSEFVTRTALANMLKNNLCGFAKDWITQLIQQKQKSRKKKGVDKKVA